MATSGIDILGSLKLVTPATGLAVTRKQAMLWCRCDSEEEYATFDLLIASAMAYVEKGTNGQCQLLPTVFDLPVSEWWDDPLKIPRPPLLSVTSVTYLNEDGASQTVDTGDYEVCTPWRQPGTVELTWLQSDSAPTLYDESAYPITIRFTAGYANAATIPANLQQAILLHVAMAYRDRESADFEAVDRLLNLEGWGSYI